jgi:hypothetical protein
MPSSADGPARKDRRSPVISSLLGRMYLQGTPEALQETGPASSRAIEGSAPCRSVAPWDNPFATDANGLAPSWQEPTEFAVAPETADGVRAWLEMLSVASFGAPCADATVLGDAPARWLARAFPLAPSESRDGVPSRHWRVETAALLKGNYCCGYSASILQRGADGLLLCVGMYCG